MEERLLGEDAETGSLLHNRVDENDNENGNENENADLSKKKIIKLSSASSLAVIALGFVGFCEYSMIMPVMAKYIVDDLGGTHLDYGMSMAVFSGARVLFMPFLGFWSDRGTMLGPFMLSIALGIAGNATYALAEFAQSKWFVFFGRAIVGLSSANSTLTMSYITRISTKETRTRALATVNGLNLVGIVMGPALNLLIDFRWDTGIKNLSFNPYTNPGWMMVILLALIGTVLLFSFEEPERNQESDEDEIDVLLSGEQEGFLPEGAEGALPIEQKTWSSVYWYLFWNRSIWVHFVISFVSNFILSELETALPDLTTRSYGWTTLQNSLMYAIIGIVTAGSLILTGVYSSLVSDRSFITAGTTTYGIALISGCLLLDEAKPPMWAFIICTLMLIVSAPLSDSPNCAAYSKRLCETKDALPYLGLYLGFIDASNGIARVVGPLYAGWALGDEEKRLRIYMGPTVIWVLSFLTLVFKYAKFKTAEEESRRRAFSSIQPVDGSVGPFMQSPMLVATPNVNLHSALTEYFTPPAVNTSPSAVAPRFTR